MISRAWGPNLLTAPIPKQGRGGPDMEFGDKSKYRVASTFFRILK